MANDNIMQNAPIDQTRNINPGLQKIVIPPEAEFTIEITGFQMAIADATVIEHVNWEMHMTYGKYTGMISGAVRLAAPDSTDFTPVADLTKDQVVAWISEREDLEEMKQRMVRTMNERLRTVITRPVFKG